MLLDVFYCCKELSGDITLRKPTSSVCVYSRNKAFLQALVAILHFHVLVVLRFGELRLDGFLADMQCQLHSSILRYIADNLRTSASSD